ncbi:MAG TPA: bifunctional hydroxymethylpyrimidine kinase/phosphomethylpyrimidine kinase [Roseiarcus sp.]
MNQRLAVALTIAGSDSGGGAGIQADLRTFAALGVYGASVVTALTAQNTRGVRTIHHPPPTIVAAQIYAVLEDFDVAAIKIGMLGNAETGGAVAEMLRKLTSPARGEGSAAFVVYDPVMIASSGAALSRVGFVEAIRRDLLPLVDCLTPNLYEAAALLDEAAARSEADMARQGAALLKLGPRAALMKGGHLVGDEAVDLLVTAQGVRRYAAPRIASRNLHGTGCTLSSAIAANVVLGMALPKAMTTAKAFVGEAIERGREVTLGAGDGPLIQAKLR